MIVAGAGVVMWCAGAAQAGLIPEGFEVSVTTGEGTWLLSENLTDITDVSQAPNGDVTVQAESDIFGSAFDWTFTICENIVDRGSGESCQGPQAFFSSAFTVESGESATTQFDVAATVPFSSMASGLSASGNSSGSLGDAGGMGDGATLAAASGSAGYLGLINGSALLSAFDDPFEVNAPAFSTVPFGAGQDSAAIMGDVTSLGIGNEFTLTPGDNASFTSTLLIVPTPGAAGVLALGLVAGMRRRR
jgi:uncharacterized protein (TIGR03382 family)